MDQNGIKIVATMTVRRVYDVKKTWYSANASVEDILSLEKKAILEDPALFMDGDNVEISVDVQLAK